MVFVILAVDFVGAHLEQACELELSALTGKDLHEAAFVKQATCGDLDARGSNELKALPLSWFVGLAWVLRGVEDMLFDAVRKKSPTADSLEGWGWRELKALPAAWFDRLAAIFTWFEEDGRWPEGLLDAYITMIPKADGDSTPLGQRPLCVLPTV